MNPSGGLACFGEAVPAQALQQVCELVWHLRRLNEDWGTALLLSQEDRTWVAEVYERCKQADPTRLTDVVPTYTRFDVGVGWTHPDGRLAVNGFVNNLTDVAYATSINANPGSNLRFFNNPRTVGVRMKVEW